MTKTTKMSPRKIKAEIASVRAKIDALHPLTLGRGNTASESEVVAYLRRDLSKLLAMSGGEAPVVDSLLR
jgi:hypothetical protein